MNKSKVKGCLLMSNSNFINKAYGFIKLYIDSMNGFNR